MSRLNPNRHINQRGFGIVEVLVSVVISMVLFAGVLNVFQSNKRAYQMKKNLSDLQTNAQYASTFLGRTIRLAGFRTTPDFTTLSSYSDFETLFPAGSEFITGTNDTVNGSDTITVRYQGSTSGNVYDCLGTLVQPNQIASNTFSINANNQLVCTAINNGVPNANNPDILVDNVQHMHIRFGEDLNGNGIASRYVPPDFPSLNLNRIVSVKISLLLKSSDATSPVIDNKMYTLQDKNVGPFNDNYQRKVFTTTIQVRATSA